MMYKIHSNILHLLIEMKCLLPQAKCNLVKGSLSYSGVMVWNSILVSIKDSSSLPISLRNVLNGLNIQYIQ